MQIFGHTDGSIQALAARLADIPTIRLRWGGPQVANAINGQVHLLDGLEQLQTMQAAGIAVPEFSVNPLWAVGQQPPEIPGIWLARKRNHAQGRDILIAGQRVRGRRLWQASDYFVKYISAVREWRFHIFRGQSIARGLKCRVDSNGNNYYYTFDNMGEPIIRSRRLGWHLRHDIDPPKGLRPLAKQAVEAIGYELGAVDLLELEAGSGIVLEVNSRPAIRDEYTLSAYERAFRAL